MSASKAVFKAYLLAELLRSRGIVYGLMGMILWMVMFILPMTLFRPQNFPVEVMSGYAFTAILVFMSYSIATWDWAWELRWLMRANILEYVIASGRSIYVLYTGIIPVSLLWMTVAITVVYAVLSALTAPPKLLFKEPLVLTLGIVLLVTVLFSHSMILGGTTISVGTSGPVMEILGWILPITTGGLVPLKNMPSQVQAIALATPYSYPAELIRYSLLGSETILPLQQMIVYGVLYAIVFLVASITYFNLQLKKMLKEGVKTVGMY